MSRRMSPIEDIHPDKETWKIGVRITTLWTVRRYNRIHSIEMILMDEQGSKIQASVDSQFIEKFGPLLKEGNTYILSNFEAQKNEGQFKVSHHPCKLSFMRTTTVQEVELPEIPKYVFTFTKFEDIISSELPHDVLVDVIGEFINVERNQRVNVNQRNAQMVAVNLQDPNKNVISCTLWDDFANQLLTYLSKHSSGPIIIILTHAKIKDRKGGQFAPGVQNSCLDISIDSYSERFSQVSQSPLMSLQDKFLRNAQLKCLSEIKDVKQDCICVTLATIDKVFAANRWFFYGCTSCGKKVNAVSSSTFQCTNCGIVDSRADPRFRIEVRVSEGMTHAKFVLWDRECVQLLHLTATELLDEQAKQGISDCNEVPEIVDSLLGKKLAFRIKLQAASNYYSVYDISDDAGIIECIGEKIGINQASACGMGESSTDSACFVTPSKRIPAEFTEEDSINLSSAEFSTSKSMKHFKS